MKPSKKKTDQVKKGENTPKIDTYFKAAAKQVGVVVEEKGEVNEGALKAIYVEALKKKLQGFAAEPETPANAEIVEHQDEEASSTAVESDCVLNSATATDLVSPNMEEREACLECNQKDETNDELKKLCIRLAISNAEMDFKFEDLLRTKTAINPLASDDTVSAAGAAGQLFTQREFKYLECMSLDKKSDSTFVHHCLQYAYKDNLSILATKTLKGKAEVKLISVDGQVERIVPGKYPLTPEKVDRIRSLFIDRITRCQLGSVAYSERIKDTYLNKLIASGIRNIVKKGDGRIDDLVEE